MTKNRRILTLGIAVLLVIGGFVYYLNSDDSNSSEQVSTAQQTQSTNSEEVTELTTPAVEASDELTTEEHLLYLIEEEKLAHDVYTKMYELYGANIFNNISSSETTHQNRVLTLLNDRDITDPRSSQAGVFTNQDLQKLYDGLIAQGSQSLTEAYKVGILIEETDIKDLSEAMTVVSEQDIVSTLEDLKNGSEKHLVAFSRQLTN